MHFLVHLTSLTDERRVPSQYFSSSVRRATVGGVEMEGHLVICPVSLLHPHYITTARLDLLGLMCSSTQAHSTADVSFIFKRVLN